MLESSNDSAKVQTGCFCPDELKPGGHRPLFIGCSGGAGHNSAIEALISDFRDKALLQKDGNLDNLPHIKPTPAKKRMIEESEYLIWLGSYLSNQVPMLSVQFRKIFDLLHIPNLPSKINDEVEALSQKQIKKGKRKYYDMLLDVVPSGYLHAAIWNILQREDRVNELVKLLSMHGSKDREHYKHVKQFFLTRLKDAWSDGKPFTEIISTQVMSLQALCDAVIEYNDWLPDDEKKITLHQYLTDMPTIACQHFFNALNKLNAQQREVVCVYGVNLAFNWQDIVPVYHLDYPSFHMLVNIDPKDNPMVRPGFKDAKLKEIENDKDQVILTQVYGAKDEKHNILSNERVVSVMLGSQAGIDTLGYVLSLAKYSNFDKVFVFAGGNSDIKEKIQNGLKDIELKNNKCQIVILDNQDDWHIAPIMVRSDLIITRAGGASVMEHMALPHVDPDQALLLHSKKDKYGRYTSGIIWEDGNGNNLISFLNKMEGLKIITKTTAEEFTFDYLRVSKDENTCFLSKAYDVDSYVDSNRKDNIEKYRDELNKMDVETLLVQLLAEIKYLANRVPSESDNKGDFIVALDILHHSLKSKYVNSKKKYLLKHPNSDFDKHYKSSAVAQITRETVLLLVELEDNKNENADVIFNIFSRYAKTCSKQPGYKTFAKIIALVAITGVVCFATAGMGFGAGLLLGAFVWKGAAMGAIIGSVHAATIGAQVGLSATSLGSGLGMGGISALRMFKKAGINKKSEGLKDRYLSDIKPKIK